MLDTHDIPSLYLGLTRRITVWLPSEPRKRRVSLYHVLYLHDGQNLFDPARAFAGQTWHVEETLADLVRRRLIPPLIVVGIDHGAERRAREYLPVEDERNPFARQPLGREHAEFVTREVLKLEAILRRGGLGARRLQVVVEEGANHSEGAWAARLPHALEFLYGP